MDLNIVRGSLSRSNWTDLLYIRASPYGLSPFCLQDLISTRKKEDGVGPSGGFEDRAQDGV